MLAVVNCFVSLRFKPVHIFTFIKHGGSVRPAARPLPVDLRRDPGCFRTRAFLKD